MGVTDFFSEIKHVLRKSNFEKKKRVNQAGLNGF